MVSAGLAVDALSFGYGSRAVGHAVSFTLAPGEVLCLLGPNGGGKSTLLKTLLGLLPLLGGAVTIDGNKVSRNPAYYILAHAAKFVRPGSVRIDSSFPAALPNVAFKTPEGKTVLIVLNNGPAPKEFDIRYQGRQAASSINGGAVATYIW